MECGNDEVGESLIYQDVVLSTYESCLEYEYPLTQADIHLIELANDIDERDVRLQQFPFFVMLKLSYAELDFTSRWCWDTFGKVHGKCQESSSEYPACTIKLPHSHWGKWMNHWFVKTDYNYGSGL